MKPTFKISKSNLSPAIKKLENDNNIEIIMVTYDPKLQTDKGYGSDKSVPTVTYKTNSNKIKTVSILIKWLHNPNNSEANHYQYLESIDAPIPALYYHLKKNKREMLLLEYLKCHPEPKIDKKFAALTAHFNSLKISAEHKKLIGHRDFNKELVGSKDVLSQVWSDALNNKLGANLKKFCTSDNEILNTIKAYIDHCIIRIAKMKKGLIHTDLYPENTGKRFKTNQLLIFDLEYIAYGPILFDIARWVGAPNSNEKRVKAIWEGYTNKLSEERHINISYNDFKRDCSILWAAGILIMLWFSLGRSLDGKVYGVKNIDEGKRHYQEKLLRNLKLLYRAAKNCKK